MTMAEEAQSAALPDQWAWVEPSGAEGAGLPEATPRSQGSKVRPAEYAVAVLAFVAAVLQMVWLLTAKSVGSRGLTTPMHSFPQELASKPVAAAVVLGAGILVLTRRTREVGLCAVACIGGLMAIDVTDYNPRNFAPILSPAEPWVFLSNIICLGVAGVIAVVCLWSKRRAAHEVAPTTRITRLVVVGAVAPAVVGLGLFAIGAFMTIQRTEIGGNASNPLVIRCCSFSQRDGYQQTADVLVCVALAVLVLIAALSRSRARSVALLAAPALFLSNGVFEYAAKFLWPEQAAFGIGGSSFDFGSLTISPEPGYWLNTAGLALLIVAAAIRAQVGRRGADPYAVPPVPAEPPAPTAASA